MVEISSGLPSGPNRPNQAKILEAIEEIERCGGRLGSLVERTAKLHLGSTDDYSQAHDRLAREGAGLPAIDPIGSDRSSIVNIGASIHHEMATSDASSVKFLQEESIERAILTVRALSEALGYPVKVYFNGVRFEVEPGKELQPMLESFVNIAGQLNKDPDGPPKFTFSPGLIPFCQTLAAISEALKQPFSFLHPSYGKTIIIEPNSNADKILAKLRSN